MRNRLPACIADYVELPVITAPMFLVSSPELVISACKSGVIGSIPSWNARTTVVLEEWMEKMTRDLALAKSDHPRRRVAPWALNIVMGQRNERLEEEFALIKKYQPPIVITALGNPAPVVEIVRSYGGLVFSDVTTLAHAKKAAKSGVDGLILVCGGAGGHAGTLNSFAFVGAVKEFWDGIIILAGGISSGHEILAAQTLGAHLVYMGTRFIATAESLAPDAYKKMLVESTLDDIIYTPTFSGIPANYLKPSIQKAGFNPEALGSHAEFSQTGRKAWRDIWSAGHGVGRTKKVQSVSEIVTELQQEYNTARSAMLSSVHTR
jgi:nitronate monooxygenase